MDSTNRNRTAHVPSTGIEKYDTLKKQFASADPDADADLGSILLAEQVKGNKSRRVLKDGSMTSDNETANEDDEDDMLDVPVRTKKKLSSKYSSKRARRPFGMLPVPGHNDAGYSTTSMAGGNRNENESDDDSRSFSTHGLYTGQKATRIEREKRPT